MSTTERGLRFRIDVACLGYQSLTDDDVPQEYIGTELEAYKQGAADAARAIQSEIKPIDPCAASCAGICDDGCMDNNPVLPPACGARIATAHPRISQTCSLPILHSGDHSPSNPPASSSPEEGK